MTHVVRRVFSQRVPLDDAEWEALEPRLRRRRLAEGEVWLRDGEVCRDGAIIELGLLRYSLVRDGTEYTGNFFLEGSVAADYGSFVTQRPALQWIAAVEPSVVWLLSHDDVERFYAAYATWERRGRLIAETVLAASQRRAVSLALDDAETRYRELIVARPKVTPRVPQYLIAPYLGITPGALSRIRRKLRLEPAKSPAG